MSQNRAMTIVCLMPTKSKDYHLINYVVVTIDDCAAYRNLCFYILRHMIIIS